jgi:hypothetical protein
VEINMRIRVLIVTFLVVLVANSVAAIDWRNYQNARFGTSADIPVGFSMLPPPENGDGQRFDGLGGSITIYGGYNFTGSFSGYRSFLKQTLEEEGWKLTYTPSADTWFVFSGLNEGQILYQRVERPAGCSSDILHHIDFRYPARHKMMWEPIVERGAKTLDGPCD